jgi:hypothetical protein
MVYIENQKNERLVLFLVGSSALYQCESTLQLAAREKRRILVTLHSKVILVSDVNSITITRALSMGVGLHVSERS